MPAAPTFSDRLNRKFADSSLEGTGFELLVRGRVKLVVVPFDAPGCVGRVDSRRNDPATAIGAGSV